MSIANLSDLERKRLADREKRMKAHGQGLLNTLDEFRKLETENIGDRSGDLLKKASAVLWIYHGVWNMGNLTPIEYANPVFYTSIYDVYPVLHDLTLEAITRAVMSGELGDRYLYTQLLQSYDPMTPFKTKEEELLVDLIAKISLGVPMEIIRLDAEDLGKVQRNINILDATDRSSFLSFPWRVDDITPIFARWEGQLANDEAFLRENWVHLQTVITARLSEFEKLMMPIFVRALQDYDTRRGYGGP